MRALVRTVLGVLITTAALIAPAVAGATTLTPAGDTFKATNVGAVTFTTNNGTGIPVSCANSAFAGHVPATGSNNNNILSGGAVAAPLTAPPTFSSCSLPSGFGSSTVTARTNATNGAWSLAAMDFPNATSTTSDAAAGDVLTMAQPKASNVTTITTALGTCTVTFSPSQSSSIPGRWVDGTNSTTSPSTWSFSAQVPASLSTASTCDNQTGPLVEIAKYAVTDTTSGHSASPIKF